MKLSIAAILVAVSAIASAQLDPNKVVLSVNGEEIKAGEYYRRMEFLPGVGKMFGQSFAQAPPGLLTIDQLVTERLVFQQAKEFGVFPTDAEVQDEIAYSTRMDANYVKGWTDSGRTLEELTYQVRFGLAQFKLISRGITFTDAEIQEFYKNNIALFTIPKQVTLKVIAVNSEETANKVDADLKAGKTFEEVAKAYSLDVSAAMDGDFGKRSYEDLAPVVRREIDKIKVGGTTAWIIDDTNKTRVKFKLVAADPEVVKPLDADLKRRIRRDQLAVRGGVRNDVRKQMNEVRQKATIVINEKEFADAYKRFIDAFLKSGG